MPVRLRPEKQILEDIVRYKAIVETLEDIGDIPTRRAKPIKRKNRQLKNQKRRNTMKENGDKPIINPKGKSIDRLKQKILLQKPSFLAKAGNEKSNDWNHMHQQRKTDKKFPIVSDLHSHAKTYEQQLLVQASYNEMVNAVRKNADNIDFGLSLKILPKNIEKENQRFHFEYESDKLMGYSNNSFLSGDIDYYFRQLGQNFPEVHAREIPLV